jgi:hypothetical protein
MMQFKGQPSRFTAERISLKLSGLQMEINDSFGLWACAQFVFRRSSNKPYACRKSVRLNEFAIPDPELLWGSREERQFASTTLLDAA